MKFFLDMNLSPRLAHGMQEFGQDVTHLVDHFDQGEKDEIWLPHVGTNGWILVTRDNRIRRNPAELRALREFQVGAFFLGGKGLSKCDIIEQVVRNWRRMNSLAEKTKRPFAYRVPAKGTKLSSIPL